MTDCLFTQCAAGYWGNGLLLRDLPSINGGSSDSNLLPPVSANCKFLSNENRVTTSGAMYYFPTNAEQTVRGNLYVSNKASNYAGAIEFNLVGDYPVTSPVFYFNFFSHNDGMGKGDDVIIFNNDKYDNAVIPFFHCFSATSSINRLSAYGDKNPDVRN